MQQGTNGNRGNTCPAATELLLRRASGALPALLLILLSLAALMPTARAQSVREESTFGMSSSYKAMKKAAEEQNFAPFPDVREGEPGTLVKLTFDRSNADITFYTPNTISAAALLTTAKTVARDLGLPQADFITADTKRLRYVDLEMNDYLQKVSRSETRFDFDLSRLRTALKESDLPRPIVFVVEPSGATVTLGDGTAARPLTDETFLRLEDVAPNSRLRWRAVVTWKMWTGAAFFGGMFLFMALMPWRLAHSRRKQREKERREGVGAAEPPDPTKVQETYDKQKPQWVQQLLLLLPMLAFPALLLLGKNSFDEFILGLTLLLPQRASLATLPLLMVGLLAGSALLCFAVEKWRERQGKAAGIAPPPNPDAEHTPPPWLAMLPLLPMGLVMFLTLPMMSIPAVSRGLSTVLGPLNPNSRFLVVFGVLMVTAFGSMLLLGWLVRKKTRQDLRPGDFWYDQVQEMAAQAGVRVRHVVVEKSPTRNAAATLLGTVKLTSKLLADLEPDEVRAIVAHEVGHHKASHPLRGMILSLAITAVLFGAYYGGVHLLEKRYTLPKEVKAMLNTPLFVIFVLPVLRSLLTGKANRQHELDADRFAVQTTGDPELVIRALRKIHTLDAQPHLLKKSDEMLQDHPSLANRIEAIRRDAETAGATSNSTP